MRPKLRRAWLPALLGLGLVLLAVELQQRASDLDRFHRPSAGVLALTVAIAAAGQFAFGVAWIRLVPDVRAPRALAWTFHGSQPAKYVPIGIGQPLGQVSLLRHLGVPVTQGTVAWVGQLAAFVAAGLFLGAGLAWTGDGWLAALSALGLLAPLLVVGSVQARVLTTLARWSRRIPAPTAIPAQRSLSEAFVIASFAVACHASAYALLADGSLQSATAYAFAFGVSTATPLPAGLGVREALLVAAAGMPPADALGAALVLRVILLGVEVVLFAASYAVRGEVTRGSSSDVTD